WSEGNKTFSAGKAYWVPTEQPQYRLIRTVFEKQLQFRDSLFYDVTSWTMPLAYGVSFAEVNSTNSRNLSARPLTGMPEGKGSFSGSASDHAWLLDWREFEAAKALYVLQSKNIIAKVATRPFTTMIRGQQVTYPAGTVVIPTQLQTLGREAIVAELQAVSQSCRVHITGVGSGLALQGIDLGSGKVQAVDKPSVAMLVGTGVSPTDAGEVWHLLDQRLAIPTTHLEISTFNRIDLNRYNTIIMVSGSQAGLNKEKLKTWIENGGILIACEDAVQWCASNGITKVKFRNTGSLVDSTKMLRYADREEVVGAQRMTGAIFRADADTTHPLCFGLQQPFIDVFKTNDVFINPSSNPYAAPIRFGQAPLQSGYITKQNYDALKGSASVMVQTVGRGRVVSMADNPNFRAFWLGSMRLFVNAIFFGRNIDAASSRGEE
ncbi:MAG TPA: hypothetical protein VK907_10335, partial [Phnomibacter sp.]|nr:hypothetical protein [Phnomibacter sp.]